MAIEVINNGSFKTYAYWNIIGDIESKLQYKNGLSCLWLQLENEQTVNNTAPTGVYQVLDLVNYDKKLSLDISFSAMHTLNEGETDEQPRYFFDLFIYKIEEYTRFATGEVWTYELPESYENYKYKRCYDKDKFTYKNNKWVDFSFNIVLDPGCYIIGFTPHVHGFDIDDENSIYGVEYKAIPLYNLLLTGVSVLLEETDVVSFHNVLTNSTFESVNAPFDRWFANSITARDVLNDNTNYYCIDYMGQRCKGLSLNKDITLDDITNNGCGLNQVVEVKYTCRAELCFWHRTGQLENNQENYGRLGYYVYKLSYYDEYNNSYSIDSIVCSHEDDDEVTGTIKSITTNNYRWSYKSRHFNIKPGLYMISIVPFNQPSVSNYTAEIFVDNVKLNLYTNVQKQYPATGLFTDPYTIEDGYFYYHYNSGYGFRFYDNTVPEKKSYVYHNGNYYIISTDDGRFYRDGMYVFTDCSVHNGPFGCDRYFFEDCRLAINEQYIHDGHVYTSNENGCATMGSFKIHKLEGYCVVNGEYKDGSIIDLLPGEEVDIIVEYPEQESPILLNITSSNPQIAEVIGITTNASSSGYNRSNSATIVAKSYGKATITASYKNVDGTIPTYTFEVYVGDDVAYEKPENITITMLTPVNYVALGTGLKLRCLVSPDISSGIPIDWISSDRQIAKVNSKGEVTPVALGQCTITAKNFATDKFALCTLYVVEQTVDPVVINTSVNSLQLGPGEEDRITALLLNEYGNISYVSQNVIWTTSDDKIAVVDDYGFVKGISKGNAIITCACASNPSIKKEVAVEVLGASRKLTRIDLNVYEINLLESKFNSVSHEYLTYTLTPSNTTETDVIWTSSNPDVVMVSKSGLVECIGTSKEPIIITCTSATNPLIYRSCKVNVVSYSDYVPIITYHKDIIKACVGTTVVLDYFISGEYSSSHSIKIRPPGGYSHDTKNTVVRDRSVRNRSILTAVEAGDYEIVISCQDPKNTYKIIPVKIYETNNPPEFVKDLEVMYVLQNGSYVLRYYVEDDMTDNANVKQHIYVDNVAIESSHQPVQYKYNGQKYYYYFGSGLTVGYHVIFIGVEDDSNDIATDTSQSSTITVNVPNIVTFKASLNEAKVSYDIAKNDLLNYLIEMMSDKLVGEDELIEFNVRYEVYCVLYDNLVDILDTCIKHINSQIGASQIEMASLATVLTSDSTSVATYSEGDYTNSNYQNITDMDYYQNECIRQLIMRVFELEARLNELTNNNN
jgi:uncharacterized protein YjdB